MTKRNNAIEILTILILTALTASAQTKPKVVFIGDNVTFNWSSAFAANKNWINEGFGSPLICVPCYGGTSTSILHRFRTDVIDLHPAIVHIMVGLDDADLAHDATWRIFDPNFLTAIDKMVKLSKEAGIKVILGIEPSNAAFPNSPIMQINSIVASYGALNDIPVINYSDALCECIGSTAATGVYTTYETIYPDRFYAFPTPAGYALMMQMAEIAINTLGVPLQGGYLQNVEQGDFNENDGIPVPNVNLVSPAAIIQFTPYGQYSNGIVEPLINSTYAGSTGTWESSKPLVMYISQTGLATALSPGYAVITYKSPSGVAFNSWVMDVQGQE
jgi:hypothetical protein